MLFKSDITPMGAVRMTGRGKFVKPAAQRYLAFKQQLGYDLKEQMKQQGEKPLEGALSVGINLYMPIPPSWSGKKQREHVGEFHTKKPDIDNMAKAIFDAANKIVWQDDNQVCSLRITKEYSETPGIFMEVMKL
jgi:Holliday junction resolvase RusA-like endonuclease